MNAARAENPLERGLLAGHIAFLKMLVSLLLGAACVWLFSPRILGRPYRGFRLVRVPAGECGRKMTLKEGRSLWFFIWWRQLVGGLAAMLLTAPLNMLLGTMRIRASSEIGSLLGLFAVGPIVMKMLVGNPLSGFRIEARRADELNPP